MSNLLKHLKIEIEAKERSVSLRHFYTERVESNCDNRFTMSALFDIRRITRKNKQKMCFFAIQSITLRGGVWSPLVILNIKEQFGKDMACIFFVFIKGIWLLRVPWAIILIINVRENTTSIFVLNLKNQMIKIIQGHQVKVIRQVWTKITRILQKERQIILPVTQPII